METKTFGYKALKYDELPEAAKQKALEQMSDINVDYDWWDGECYLELSEKEMRSRHIKLSEKWYEHIPKGNIPGEYPAYTGLFKWKHLYFDLDRRQYVQFVDLEVKDDNVFRIFLRIPKRLWEKCSYSFTAGRENNTQLVIEAQDRDFTEKEQSIIDRAVEIFSDKVHEGWRMLRDEYEGRLGREAIEETIRANSYDFFEDGRRTMVLAA